VAQHLKSSDCGDLMVYVYINNFAAGIDSTAGVKRRKD